MGQYWVTMVLMVFAVILLVATSWLDAKARAYEKAFMEQQLALASQQEAYTPTQSAPHPHTPKLVEEVHRAAA
jgi:type II secretory pathway pseudopilin PulG